MTNHGTARCRFGNGGNDCCTWLVSGPRGWVGAALVGRQRLGPEERQRAERSARNVAENPRMAGGGGSKPPGVGAVGGSRLAGPSTQSRHVVGFHHSDVCDTCDGHQHTRSGPLGDASSRHRAGCRPWSGGTSSCSREVAALGGDTPDDLHGGADRGDGFHLQLLSRLG